MDLDTVIKVIGIIMGSIITFSAFVAAVVYLLDQHKKTTRALLKEDFEQINKKIDDFHDEVKEELSDFHDEVNKRFDNVEAKQEKAALESCKNFLVKCLDDFEHGKKVSSVLMDRFWKQYDYYISRGQNSSIKTRTEALVASGVISRITKGE